MKGGVSGLYDDDGIDGPFEKAMAKRAGSSHALSGMPCVNLPKGAIPRKALKIEGTVEASTGVVTFNEEYSDYGPLRFGGSSS